MTLAAERLEIAVAGRVLVHALTFTARAGELTCVLGENGAGKTLTLHTLAGLRAADGGSITLAGRPLASWPRRERARRLGLLMQATEDPFPGTVLDAVLVGRHPYLDFWQWEGEADLDAARAALAACDLAGFEPRALATLSGGERRRAALAAVLAQDPQVLLLDEPQNHLDPHHQLDVLKLLRARADAGGTVVATLHDPSLAARFADRVLLLYGSGGAVASAAGSGVDGGAGRWLHGTTAEVLTAATLSGIYRLPMREFVVEGRRLFVSD